MNYSVILHAPAYTKALMDSMPKMESKEKRLKALKGMVPSLLNMGDRTDLFQI